MHGTPWTQFADAVLAMAVAQAWPEDSSSKATPKPPALQTGRDLSTDVKSAEKLLVERRAALHESLSGSSAFSTLVANAALLPAEAEALALCASIDADVRRQRLIGWLQEDLALTRPGLDLLGRLLGSKSSGALTVGASSGLVRAAIVDIGTQGPWGARSVGIESSVLWALAGEGSPDPELPAGTSFFSTSETPDIAEAPLVFVTGPDRSKRRRHAAAATAGIRFVVGTQPTDERGWGALVREATIRGAGIIVECDSDLSQDGRRWIERATHLPWAVSSTHEISVNALPDRPWAEHYVAARVASPDEWADQFPELQEYVHRLTSDQLSLVAEISSNIDSGLEGAVRRLSSGPIDRLARRVRPRYQWEDLVLDNDRSDQLRELLARYRNSQIVYSDWGFPAIPSSGLIAMFSGDPGTGKTMSAEVLAGELGLDLFVVDLAAVVSKYIGETEKNLEEIFSAAAVGNQVLFFDEADSLFGKRTEVSDARDRYANLEVSYLLQRIEIFEGLVVLATNFSNNIDSAFLRRIDISIDFVQPEEPQREELWRRSFPPNAPLADDVDPNELAAVYELSGGSIRKASLYAAFLAAEAGEHISRDRISLAVDREYQKLGRLRPGKKLGR
ncbi:MAG: AAA family ATPase [Actinobacteria bacterium]|nr:AAA family ATPase [Actinomycetota bacterium]